MDNNIHMESSFNPTEISIQKVFKEPKSALFHFEGNGLQHNDKCLVRFLQLSTMLNTLNKYYTLYLKISVKNSLEKPKPCNL